MGIGRAGLAILSGTTFLSAMLGAMFAPFPVEWLAAICIPSAFLFAVATWVPAERRDDV
jgi:hypothetical protein